MNADARAGLRARIIDTLASAQFAVALTQLVFGTMLGAFAIRSVIGWAGYIAIVGGLVVLGALSLVARREYLDWHGLLPVSLIAFLLWSGLSVIWSGYQWATLSSALYQSATAFLAITVCLTRDTIQIIRALGNVMRVVLVASLTVEVLSGLLIDLPITFLKVQGNLAIGGPIQGIFGTRNQLGYIAVLALCTFVVEGLTKSVSKGAAIASVALAGGLLLFTRSVVSLGVVVMVVIIGAILRGIRRAPPERRRALQITTIVGASVFGIATWIARSRIIDLLNAGSEFEYRQILWREVWASSAQSPILGQGWVGYWRPDLVPFAAIDALSGRPHASALNGLFDVYLQLGLVGAVLLIALTGLAFVRSWVLASTRMAVVYVWPILVLAVVIVISFAESSILVDMGFLLLVICSMKAAQGLSWRSLLTPAVR